MSKGVYRRYRGSRNNGGFIVPTLVILCIIAAAVLVYINANIEDRGDGTTALVLPFREEPVIFGKVQEPIINDQPNEDAVAEQQKPELPEYEARIEMPQELVFDEEFDAKLATVEGKNTILLKYKADNGKVLDTVDAKEACKKIQDAGLNACAMISCFRDNEYARDNENLACVDEDEDLWVDGNEYAWLNPYKEETRAYLRDIIEQAYDAGFKEILLTNVGFPLSDEVYYGDEGEKNEAINAFLKMVKELSAEKPDLRIAIYFDGTDNGQDINVIVDNFYRIHTRNPDIYNKVGNILSTEEIERRIVNRG